MPPAGKGGRILLDTNILIALLAGEPPVVAAARVAVGVFIPAIALGELYYGALKSGRPAENIERVSALATVAVVLPCDAATAPVYGRLKATLRAKGAPIPENDLWIAALAVQHNLTLVTRDVHFSGIPDLALESWS